MLLFGQAFIAFGRWLDAVPILDGAATAGGEGGLFRRRQNVVWPAGGAGCHGECRL